MFNFLKTIEKYGFTFLVLICIIFLCTVAVYQQLKGHTSGSYWYSSVISDSGKPLDISHEESKPNGYSKINVSQNFNKSKGELMCKAILEELFNKPFISIRPDWLKNPIGTHNLELDCYNKELGLAVEYSGIQHFEYTPRFHKNKECLKTQQYRDYIKKQACEKNGVTLIVVPYTVKHSKIKEYLYSAINLQYKKRLI